MNLEGGKILIGVEDVFRDIFDEDVLTASNRLRKSLHGVVYNRPIVATYAVRVFLVHSRRCQFQQP